MENALPSGQSTRLRVERSGFETGAGTRLVVVILLVASLHGNQDKLQLGGPIGLSTDFTFNKR